MFGLGKKNRKNPARCKNSYKYSYSPKKFDTENLFLSNILVLCHLKKGVLLTFANMGALINFACQSQNIVDFIGHEVRVVWGHSGCVID